MEKANATLLNEKMQLQKNKEMKTGNDKEKNRADSEEIETKIQNVNSADTAGKGSGTAAREEVAGGRGVEVCIEEILLHLRQFVRRPRSRV